MVKHLKQNSPHTIIAQIISSWQAIISTFTPFPLDETLIHPKLSLSTLLKIQTYSFILLGGERDWE